MNAARFFLIIFFSIFFLLHPHVSAKRKDPLPEIKALSHSFKGKFGLYALNLRTKSKFEWKASEKYYLSSVIKLFVLIEAIRQNSEGKFPLNKKIVIKKSHYRDGSTVLNWIKTGRKISINRLIQLMIHHSDNAATDLLINLLDLDNINKTIKKYGYDGPEPIITMLDVRRHIWSKLNPVAFELPPSSYIEIWKTRNFSKKVRIFEKEAKITPGQHSSKDLIRAYEDYYEKGYNTASLEFTGKLLEDIWYGKIISRKACVKILTFMKGCRTGENRLKKGFPPGTLFFQKTGTQFRTACNIGIAYNPGKAAFILCFCAKGYNIRKNAEELMQNLGRTIYISMI